ncbi:UBP1-associated protein 2C [Sesamum angolense]|uniref:UBP1-associated protein 2C n=1 Tax=Sesamum angolense TaxID=2727404 RepID=A0AAE2BVC4_9LAMI|nr:UBP1-associated protein 2C [Sesamum angolense]
MDLAKKRKADENGRAYPLTSDISNTAAAAAPPPIGILSPEDAEKILEPFTKEQLLPILRAAVLRHPDVLEAVRTVADADPVQRKLFVRGLGWETTTEKLRQVFAAYGELDEANTIVITDKNSGKSKGYGFVTFKHIDAAILALKEPNKKIDGRITVTQLAAAGNSGNSHSSDVALRKIYVGNIPFEISSERLLSHFSMYGEIEEGPLGFDKQTGKAKGFAFFVYKTEEGAKASLVDPMKTIDGHQAPNYGMGGYMGYGPGPNMAQPPQPTGMMHQNSGYNTAMGGPGGPGGQGYGGGYGGGASIYDGVGGAGPGEFGGGLGNAGGYRIPPTSIGMQSSGGYPDGGNYGLQATYPSQQNHPGAGPGPRLPTYQGMPPY